MIKIYEQIREMELQDLNCAMTIDKVYGNNNCTHSKFIFFNDIKK